MSLGIAQFLLVSEVDATIYLSRYILSIKDEVEPDDSCSRQLQLSFNKKLVDLWSASVYEFRFRHKCDVDFNYCT